MVFETNFSHDRTLGVEGKSPLPAAHSRSAATTADLSKPSWRSTTPYDVAVCVMRRGSPVPDVYGPPPTGPTRHVTGGTTPRHLNLCTRDLNPRLSRDAAVPVLYEAILETMETVDQRSRSGAKSSRAAQRTEASRPLNRRS